MMSTCMFYDFWVIKVIIWNTKCCPILTTTTLLKNYFVLKIYTKIGFPFNFNPVLITAICYYFAKKSFWNGTLSCEIWALAEMDSTAQGHQMNAYGGGCWLYLWLLQMIDVVVVPNNNGFVNRMLGNDRRWMDILIWIAGTTIKGIRWICERVVKCCPQLLPSSACALYFVVVATPSE